MQEYKRLLQKQSRWWKQDFAGIGKASKQQEAVMSSAKKKKKKKKKKKSTEEHRYFKIKALIQHNDKKHEIKQPKYQEII